MKKVYKFLLMSIVVSSTMFYSCETIELEDLASPNSLSSDQADPDLLLNSIQRAYRTNAVVFNDNSAQLARLDNMFGRNYLNNFDGATLDGVWTRFFSNNGFDGISVNVAAIATLDAANPDSDLSFHVGVGKIMQAHNLMQLVEWLGDIPWSEANNPNEFPSPTVDDDAAVYAAAEALIDEAITLLNGSSGVGTATDLYYGGDISKWIKLANTLKMRAELTKGNYGAVVTATGVIESNADDFQFNYGTNVLSPDTRHPDYANDYTSSGANIYQSSWIMDLMVGQFGDFSADTDPRRRYYFFRQSWRTPGNYALFEDVNGLFGPPGNVYISDGAGNGETLQCSLQDTPTHLQFTPDEAIWCSNHLGYWGRSHGNDEGTPPDNFTRTAVGVYPAGGSFDWRADAFPYVGDSPTATFGQQVALGGGGAGAGIEPIMLASYVDFMKAEAYLAMGNATDAATHFEAGITKSIAKVQTFSSLDASAPKDEEPDAAYVADFIQLMVDQFNNAAMTTGVDGTGFPTAKDKMDILGEQYFVAMYGGAGDAFNFIRRTGYPRTLNRSLEANPGPFPRTVLYPNGEISSNPNILQRTDQTTKVFWDAGVLNPAN